MGKAMFTIIGAMAELERNVIRERVVVGMEYTRQHGTKSGNGIGRPKRVFNRGEVIRLREGGLSIEKIARQMSLGVGTVVRVLRAQESQPGTVKIQVDVTTPAAVGATKEPFQEALA